MVSKCALWVERSKLKLVVLLCLIPLNPCALFFYTSSSPVACFCDYIHVYISLQQAHTLHHLSSAWPTAQIELVADWAVGGRWEQVTVCGSVFKAPPWVLVSVALSYHPLLSTSASYWKIDLLTSKIVEKLPTEPALISQQVHWYWLQKRDRALT